MSTTTNEKYLPISDTTLAAYLSINFPVDHLEPDKDFENKVLFYFKREPALDEAVEAYWKNTATVNPQLFAYNIKVLKNRIRSMIQSCTSHKNK